MIKKATSVFKYTFSLGLALALLYLAFRNVDFSEFIEKSKQVNYTWVIISILLSLVAYYARAYRWNILLKPLGYPNLNVHKTNLAVLVGYLANLAFPRLGEVTRCGMMKRSDDVPVSTSLGTVITERIIDLFTLIALILLALVLEYDRLIEFLTHIFSGLQDVEGLMWKAGMIIVIGGALVFILGYVLYVKNEKVRSFINDLIRGILSLKDVKNRWGFALSTIVLWVTYYFMSYIIVFSIPETAHLSWVAGIMLLVTGGIALAVPVQGGIGTYHAFISAMLVLYSVEKTTGVFLATLLHTSQIVAIAIFGGIALLVSVFIKKSHERDSTEDRQQK
ncbi:lysylphosphatidylglycerol synthase transmembrane domain-containing protein [Marinoscillum luteum]|uniref:Lysylphosphatidylglycerol synthase transmembrane domain-containing protein n=1 Tax=Marinoscillum luteum TaxID=861051 RepID=A0ABW7NBV0_9BACT